MAIGLAMCPYWANIPPISLAYLHGGLKRDDLVICDFNHQYYQKHAPNSEQCFDHRFSKIPSYMGEHPDFNRFEADVQTYAETHAEDLAQWADQLSECGVVGLSIYQTNIVPTTALARILKSQGKQLIAGGPSVNMDKHVFSKYFLEHGVFDVCVLGIGEDVIGTLVKRLERREPLDDIDGLIYMGALGPVFTQTKRSNLEHKIFPCYDAFDLNAYFTGVRDRMYIYTVIGCMGKCEFCTIHEMYFGFATKPVDHIIEELQFLKAKYGYTKFFLSDGMFLGGKKPAMKLFHFAVEAGIQLGIQIRVRKYWLDDELVELASKCLYFLQIGFESASPVVRKAMRKLVDDEATTNIFSLFYKHQLPLYVNIIVGYPNETAEEFACTERFVDTFSKQEFVLGCGTNAFFIPNSFPSDKYDITYLDGHWVSNRVNVLERVYRVERLCRIAQANGKPRSFIYGGDNVEGIMMRFYDEPRPADISGLSLAQSKNVSGFVESFYDMDFGYYYVRGWAIAPTRQGAVTAASRIIITDEEHSFSFAIPVADFRADVSQHFSVPNLCCGFEAFVHKSLLPQQPAQFLICTQGGDSAEAIRLNTLNGKPVPAAFPWPGAA